MQENGGTVPGQATAKLVDLEDGLAGDSIKDADISNSALSPDTNTTATLSDPSSPASPHHHDHVMTFMDDSSLAQILGVVILEFGVIFHSFIIGLTLAVNAEFVPLFCVLIL